MATILRQLPFFDHFTTIEVQGHPYRIFPYQIVLWASVGPVGASELDPHTPRFPVILDTGFTDNFLIHREQLRHFAGLEAESLRRGRDDLRARGRQIPIRAANLWLHSNRPGERNKMADRSPILLELHRGIGVCTDSDVYPRLPLLGARALHRARARLVVDYWRSRVSLAVPSRWWFLGWRWW
jgi:hypothetical protein